MIDRQLWQKEIIKRKAKNQKESDTERKSLDILTWSWAEKRLRMPTKQNKTITIRTKLLTPYKLNIIS